MGALAIMSVLVGSVVFLMGMASARKHREGLSDTSNILNDSRPNRAPSTEIKSAMEMASGGIKNTVGVSDSGEGREYLATAGSSTR
jgi:hypothetical protein